MVKYIPKSGDIIFVDFNPAKKHEQKGMRPALVISNSALNRYTGLAVVCPITNTIRDYVWHIKLNVKQKTSGTIMCDQIKTIDYNFRTVKFKEQLDSKTFLQVKVILAKLFDINKR